MDDATDMGSSTLLEALEHQIMSGRESSWLVHKQEALLDFSVSLGATVSLLRDHS